MFALRNRLNENQLGLNSINSKKGASSWLKSYPISDHRFELIKQQFWDNLRLRYGWVLQNMPSTCCCSANMEVQHAVSCKRGGFVTIRHNDLRDLTANLLSNVCNDVEIEPKLLLLLVKIFQIEQQILALKQDLISDQGGFWVKGQEAFFDIKVFDLNAKRYLNSALPQCYVQNEKVKKRR